MIDKSLYARFKEVAQENIPFPGRGSTAQRHRQLMKIGREDLALARLAEAHWDALAILEEAGREADPDATYGVWASGKPGQSLKMESQGARFLLNGVKMFCSGATVVDRALLTVGESPSQLIDLDLRANRASIQFDETTWNTTAFAQTKTATAIFSNTVFTAGDLVGDPGWYLARPGFWHGACGPAACWAGGASGLLDFALRQSRNDPHTLAHLGAIHASVWALGSFLDTAGREIDNDPAGREAAQIRALSVRHLIEQACTEILRRLPRAYGPYPLAMEAEVSRRYQELDLYLRQSHAERDLESLAHVLLEFEQRPVSSQPL